MREYASASHRGESYEVANSAAGSLRRYKLTPAYRVQLRRAIIDANAADLSSATDLEKRKIKLAREIAKTELEYLESGGAPSALSGHIALCFRQPAF